MSAPNLPNASRFARDVCPVCCGEVDTSHADDMFRRDGEGIVETACEDCGALLRIETYAVRDAYEEGGVSLEHEVKERRAARGAA